MRVIDHIHGLTIPPVLDVHGKWIFCRNPKVATTSICEGPLRKTRILDKKLNKNWRVVWNEIIVPNFDNVQIFTFVRNTWERVLSAFLHCRDRAMDRHYKIDPKWEFRSWIKEVLAVQGTEINMHFTPQYETFCCDGEPIPGLFVGRFERLEKDWKILANKLNLDSQLPVMNARKDSDHSPCVPEYYDAETEEIVAEIYAPEIESLNYRFGE